MKLACRWTGARAIGLAVGIAGAAAGPCTVPATWAADSAVVAGPEIEIGGVVEDAAGQPIEGADVVITRPDGSGRRIAITDAAGGFGLALAEAGPVQLLVVTGRGAKVAQTRLDLAPGGRIDLVVREGAGGAALGIVESQRAFMRPAVIAPPGQLGLSRDRDLAGALVNLPGTGPAAAPSGGPVIAGLGSAEIPLTFEGFLLNDPVDGATPVDLPLSLLGEVAIDRGPAPVVALFAPHPQRNGLRVAAGEALATGARGADGAARPQGATAGWSAEAQAEAARSDGRARGMLATAPQRSPWDADPASVVAPRGRRRLVVPVLGWGAAEAGGWQFDGGGLGSWSTIDRGRTGRLLLPDEPAGEKRAWWLLGARARRQLAPGSNDLAVQAGFLRSDRSSDAAALPTIDQSGSRLTLAAILRLSGRWGAWHRLSLGTGLDLERALRGGGGPSRQPGAVFTGADARAFLPWLDLCERLLPVRSLEIEIGGRLGGDFLRGRTGLVGQPDLARSFSTDLLVAPRARLQWHPPGADLAFFASAGRRAVALPLDVLLAGAAGPRADLPAPAEDAVAVGALWQRDSVTLGLTGHARRTATVIEDRFSPTSGQLELFAPPGAERRTRAIVADAEARWSALRAGLGAILARQEGTHAGFIDEATGQLHPSGTGAFDDPDVALNRSGPLPVDRPYGLRGFVEGTSAEGRTGFSLWGAVRGRIDAGTPRAATGRSAASGPGEVFLVERGSLGRTSAVAALDAAVKVARPFAGRRIWLGLEGFNLTQQRPVVTRDPVFSDAVLTPADGARGLDGLARARDPAGVPAQQSAQFGRAVAYAEPLLVRLLVGCDF